MYMQVNWHSETYNYSPVLIRILTLRRLKLSTTNGTEKATIILQCINSYSVKALPVGLQCYIEGDYDCHDSAGNGIVSEEFESQVAI